MGRLSTRLPSLVSQRGNGYRYCNSDDRRGEGNQHPQAAFQPLSSCPNEAKSAAEDGWCQDEDEHEKEKHEDVIVAEHFGVETLFMHG